MTELYLLVKTIARPVNWQRTCLPSSIPFVPGMTTLEKTGKSGFALAGNDCNAKYPWRMEVRLLPVRVKPL